MNWGLLFASGLCALLALGALWFFRNLRREVALMAGTATSNAADVAALAPGTMVEVKGTIRCDKPMTGSFSQRLCVYAKSEIERRETRRRNGKTETHYVTESSTENHVPFYVEDASGRVLVQPHGASIEATEVYNQSGNTGADSMVSLGLTLMGAGSNDRRFKESVLAPDIPVYVLGTVVAGGAIGAAPSDAAVREFIITHKSEEARIRSSKIIAAILIVVAVGLGAGAGWALWAAFQY